ncbi:hypothetical protein Anas_00438 [Armadillidium nasatum]|uniref:Afadin n=1 Tax=Armadillidium nasatum TaxID=96803 RepID=A0A5N5TJ87_9CRUS|nr:hypothetical protein Anas_00438 [Armadillidium nasatum]
MVGTGPVVTLEVARQGALYHGLAPLLSQPSPQVATGMQDMRRETQPQQHANAPFNPMQQQSQPTPSTHSPPHQHPPQQQPHFPHHHQQPRMQSSKSVPSLNSDFQHPAGGKSASHEVFNPAYSRTSSSTSLSQQQHSHTHQHQQQIQHQQQYPIRSRSTQNLNEGNALTLTGRHPSSPALNTEDDRHYQNISFHQGPQDPRMGSQRGGRPPIFPPHSPPQEQGRPNSAFMHREDPRIAEPLQRPTSQQNLRPDMRYGPGNEDPRKRPNGFPMHQQSPGAGGGFSPSQGPGINAQGPRQQYPRGHPKYNYPYGSQPQMPTHAHPGQMSPQGYYYTQNPAGSPQAIPPQPMSPQYANSPQSTSTLKQPPPTAPKPNRNSGSFGQEPAPEKPLRQTSIENNISNAVRPNGPARPGPEEGYRDSPPPPPPPTSTHPLVQAGTRTTQSSAFGKTVPGIRGPWDRDEKEKYENRKREAARRWRDEQIATLENMGTKTPQEEERMNTLKLEREFQRRAEERLKGDEDEEEDEDEDDDILEGESIPKVERSINPVLEARPPNGEIAQDQQSTQQHFTNRGNRTNEGAPIKRVQFSESSPVETHITYDSNANQEKVSAREDPDDFINEAENLMNSSPNRSTGTTPGVIGAQEVYRDPRQRRLMEQAQKAAASRGPGPEKLTFREKMKMFAMEAEEGVETPKDKLKHSRAQREIEHGSS